MRPGEAQPDKLAGRSYPTRWQGERDGLIIHRLTVTFSPAVISMGFEKELPGMENHEALPFQEEPGGEAQWSWYREIGTPGAFEATSG
jgi:hypothetical protein